MDVHGYHITAPTRGLAGIKAMQFALQDAGINRKKSDILTLTELQHP